MTSILLTVVIIFLSLTILALYLLWKALENCRQEIEKLSEAFRHRTLQQHVDELRMAVETNGQKGLGRRIEDLQFALEDLKK